MKIDSVKESDINIFCPGCEEPSTIDGWTELSSDSAIVCPLCNYHYILNARTNPGE